MTIDLTDLTMEELQDLISTANQEQTTRQTRQALERDINQVLLDARQAGAAHRPPDYFPKDGVHIDKSYALGETTVKDGKRYRSAIPNNRCIPGECRTGWIEEPETPDENE